MACRSIGLALGGGAARGLAHIGVLKALEEMGIKPSYIAGTSSGSIIGALYAAGVNVDEMTTAAHETAWRNLVRPVVPRRSLVSADRMKAYLEQLLGNRTFAQLNIPFAAVAVDLISGEKVVLQEGSVAEAVVASCSIPGIFPPVEWQDHLLVDGGVLENVPYATVRAMGAERIIAVDLYAHRGTAFEPSGIFAIIMRSFEIMRTYHSFAEDGSHVCIAPDLRGESLVDLHKPDQYIESGYQAVAAKREEILRLVEWSSHQTSTEK